MGRKVDCYGLTDVGRARAANEDQFLIADLDKSMQVRQCSLADEVKVELTGSCRGKLLVIADGMGGHASGERASSIAVDALAGYVMESVCWFCRIGMRSDDGFLDELKGALNQCQSKILAEAFAEPERYGMGTTVTMVYVAWPKFYLAHAGDSRCYWMRGPRLRQITRDHTVAQQCVDNGSMSPETAKSSWLNNALWNVVGGPSDSLETEVYKAKLHGGDTLMLCTDGLNKHVPDEVIAGVLAEQIDAHAACRRLVDLAIQGGGTDNVTVIVARFPADEHELDDEEHDSILDHPFEKSTFEMDTLPLERTITRAEPPRGDDKVRG